jgi:tetratricopeptide (TPR) repeat protein
MPPKRDPFDSLQTVPTKQVIGLQALQHQQQQQSSQSVQQKVDTKPGVQQPSPPPFQSIQPRKPESKADFSDLLISRPGDKTIHSTPFILANQTNPFPHNQATNNNIYPVKMPSSSFISSITSPPSYSLQQNSSTSNSSSAKPFISQASYNTNNNNPSLTNVFANQNNTLSNNAMPNPYGMPLKPNQQTMPLSMGLNMTPLKPQVIQPTQKATESWGNFDFFDNKVQAISSSNAPIDVFDDAFLQYNPGNTIPQLHNNVGDDPLGLLGQPIEIFKKLEEKQKVVQRSESIIKESSSSMKEGKSHLLKDAIKDRNNEHDEHLSQMVSMGFDTSMAEFALNENDGNLKLAIDYIVAETQAPNLDASNNRISQEHEQSFEMEPPRNERDKFVKTASAIGTSVFKNAKSLFEFGKKKVIELAQPKTGNLDLGPERDGYAGYVGDYDSECNESEITRKPYLDSNHTPSQSHNQINTKPQSNPSSAKTTKNARDATFGTSDMAKETPMRTTSPSSNIKQPSVSTNILLGKENTATIVSNSIPTTDLLFMNQPAAIERTTISPDKSSNYKDITQMYSKQPSNIVRSDKQKVFSVSADPQILEQCETFKAKGNDSFKRGQFHEAVEFYTSAINIMPAKHELLITLYNNRASGYLKTGEYKACRNDCNGVLEMDSNNAKALLKRANAYEALEEWNNALTDYKLLMGSNPSTAVSLGLSRCNQAIDPAQKPTGFKKSSAVLY